MPTHRSSALALSVLSLPVLAAAFAPAAAQDPTPTDEQVQIVGSSTLHPLALEVARRASEQPNGGDFAIAATGTVAGIERFCAGLGHPEVLNASRRMREADVAACAAHGVTALVEVKVGYDGVTLAESVQAPSMDLSTSDLYLALAARVPDPAGDGRLVANPYTSWAQIDPTLPDRPIRVLGPPTTSGTRDAFGELALEAGCGLFDAVRREAGRDRRKLAEICRTMRADGVYREAGEDDIALASALAADPSLVGIFGYYFLEANRGRLKAVAVDGVLPARQSIATGEYPLGRGLFVYYKKPNLERRPAIVRYVDEFTSEAAWGDAGYLQQAGLVPMMLNERQKYAYIAEHHVDPGCPPFCR